ncbi:MAG: hypothetical protein ACE5HD_09445 [Acidobacteriota bacterium]
MNTPAHAIFNLALLARRGKARLQAAVLAGAVLPDLPILLFYVYEKTVVGAREAVIWSETYWRAGWQNLFDSFHSLPFMAVGYLLARRAGSAAWSLFFLSMGCHVLGDLPLHHDDAHRHFFPLSNWRFASPVSYWDPRYHGRIVAPLEILAALLCCAILLRSRGSMAGKVAAGLVAVIYLIPVVYILVA